MKTTRILFAALSLVVASAASAQVYTQTNEPSGNQIAELSWNTDGSLARPSYYATGGFGATTGLGTQGALTMSEDKNWLFVVNGGSNDISTFHLTTAGPVLVSRTPSHGSMPVSVTSRGGLVYVANAGGNGSISGFRIKDNGQLTYVTGSTWGFSTKTPAVGQIGFNTEGDTVYVTEKNTNRIDIYAIGPMGGVVAKDYIKTTGATPFGFAAGRRGKLLVTEAGGGPNGTSAVSSYVTADDGYASVVGASVPTWQNAACWAATTWDGQFLYTGNGGGSDSVTGYRIFDDGSILLLTPSGATGKTPAGSGSADLATDATNLYSLAAKKGDIVTFAIQQDGSLKRTQVTGGLPTTSTGIVVRY